MNSAPVPGQETAKVGLDDYLADGGCIEDIPMEEPGLEQNNQRMDGASRLLGLVEAAGVELWHDEAGAPYATYKIGSATAHCPIPSTALCRFLSKLQFDKTERGLPDSVRETTLNTMAAKACHEGGVHPVGLRIESAQGKAYLALHDENGTVVEVDGFGWRTIDGAASPVRFVRGQNALALPVPVRGGSIGELRRFVNVHDEDWPLVVAWLAGCFLPVGTFAVLSVTGEQGSGKSFGSRVLMDLLDPSAAGLRTMPKDHGSLMACLGSTHVLALDNLSGLSEGTSDALCRIASGIGLATRTLFSTTEETVVKARRPILLNGIAEIVTKPDLADRTLVVRFLRLDRGPRVGETELEEDFERLKARILGALLDRVVRAIARRADAIAPDIRLMDFAKWAIGACESPDEEEDLRRALESSRSHLTESTLEADDFAMALRTMVERDLEWTGSASELSNVLWTDDRKPQGWPTSGQAVAARLKRFAPEFRRIGIEIEQLARLANKRPWRLVKVPPLTSQTSHTSSAVNSEPGNEPLQDDVPDDAWMPIAGGPSAACGRPSNLFDAADDEDDVRDIRNATSSSAVEVFKL